MEEGGEHNEFLDVSEIQSETNNNRLVPVL